MRSQDDKRVRRRRITRPLTDLGPTGATTGIYIIQATRGREFFTIALLYSLCYLILLLLCILRGMNVYFSVFCLL